MPTLVAAAVTYLVPILGAYGVEASIGATIIGYASFAEIIGYAVVLGGSIAYGQAQSSKLRNALKGSSADQGRNVMARDPLAARRIIYGQVPVTGPIVFMATTGTKNEFLHVIVALAGRECDSIPTIYFDNFEEVTLDGSGNATGKYAGYFICKKHLGTASQAADATLIAAAGSLWTSAHKLSGIAYIYCQFKYNTDLFPNGMPLVRASVKGAKVYDPRDGAQDPADSTTWLWSSNWALCTVDYLHDATFGKGIPWARIDLAGLPNEANISDESITLLSGSEPRYALNGTATSDQSPDTVLQDMCAAGAGKVTETGGIWCVLAGAYRTPGGHTFVDDDLAGPFNLNPRQSMRETFSGVKGTFYSPDNLWVPSDFVPQVNATYKANDGGVRRWKDVAYGFVTSSYQAQRLAKIELERGRLQKAFTANYKLTAFGLKVGDTLPLTRAVLGYTAKPFEVLAWEFQIVDSADGNKSLVVAITARETASGVYDWDDGSETAVSLAPQSSLPDPNKVPTPGSLTLLADNTTSISQNDGTFVPRLKVTWADPANTYVSEGGVAIIDYKKHADSTWINWNTIKGDVLIEYITDIKFGDAIDVRVIFRNAIGARSNNNGAATAPDYATSSDYTIAAPPVPNAPTALVCSVTDNDTAFAPPRFATPAGSSLKMGVVKVSWTASTSKDVDHYEIRISPLTGSPSPYDDVAIRTKGNETSIFAYNRFTTDISGNNATIDVRAISYAQQASSYCTSVDTPNSFTYGTQNMAIQDKAAVNITGGVVVAGGLQANVTSAVDTRGVNFRVYDGGGMQQMRVNNVTGEIVIAGVTVLKAQYGSTPATTADLIAMSQYHGLCP